MFVKDQVCFVLLVPKMLASPNLPNSVMGMRKSWMVIFTSSLQLYMAINFWGEPMPENEANPEENETWTVER